MVLEVFHDWEERSCLGQWRVGIPWWEHVAELLTPRPASEEREERAGILQFYQNHAPYPHDLNYLVRLHLLKSKELNSVTLSL